MFVTPYCACSYIFARHAKYDTIATMSTEQQPEKLETDALTSPEGEGGEEVGTQNESTKHEPHEHAHKRVLIGIGAVVVVAIVSVVWARWGGEIKEACFGKDVCTVEMATTTLMQTADEFEVDADTFPVTEE